MIKHFNKRRSLWTKHRPVWPENPVKVPMLFSERKALRKLRAVVDADLIDVTNSAEKVDKATTLLALLNSEVVECYRYVNGLPPAGIEPVEGSRLASPYPIYPGWAVAYPFDTDNRHWPVVHSLKPGKTYSVGGIRDNFVERARNDESQSVYAELLISALGTKASIRIGESRRG
jgi:hypothetical protein